MIELRPFEKLGKSDHGWLNANFHFSFAEYRNPDRVHWGALRVWNNDRIAPDSGFPPHPHRDMEIVTYVIKGAITHQDHLGNEGRTEAGQIQVMSQFVAGFDIARHGTGRAFSNTAECEQCGQQGQAGEHQQASALSSDHGRSLSPARARRAGRANE